MSTISPTVKILDKITKSASDKRDYRGLELANGLKVLLISDSETDKSAGALSVGAGAMSDPAELPGLAHFCEHMLFLGTQKYPDESGFDKFLSSHGGGSNASTYSDCTTYRFDVAPENLPEALDRFAQFFVHPLFNESATEREVNAVNSENDKNIPNDNRRVCQVEKLLMDQSHPYSNFFTGNLYSLWTRPNEKSINVREALLAFHQTYYSSNIMAVAVLGKENLDQLQDMVVEMFSPIQSKNIELPSWTESPHKDEFSQIRINVSPLKDLRKLWILFPAPDVTRFYKSASMEYLIHLVGHEGPGSLLSLLKGKNWANELSAWSNTCGRGTANFEIGLDLSEEGWEQQNYVVEHVFQYLKMLRALGPQEWIWEEIRDINEIEFRFKEKRQAEFYVFNLAQKAHDCPNLEDILSAGYLITEYRPELITEILDGLIPEKCRITTLAKANDSKANLTEQWYNTKYFTEKIDPSLIQKWKNCERHADLTLPPRNEFIPSVFDLKPRDHTGITPRILVNNRLTIGWFLQDNEFLLPNASVHVELFSHLPLLDPLSYVLNHMMVQLVADKLTELSFMPLLAGLWYSISATKYGIKVQFSGYDQKLGLLIYKVLDGIANFECSSDRLNVLLEKYKRSIKNWENEEPRIHAGWYLSVMMAHKKWTKQQLLTATDEITTEKLLNYAKQFTLNLKLNILVVGNLTSAESIEVMQQCQKIFQSKGTRPLQPELIVRTKEVQLRTGSDVIYQKEHLIHSNSCALVFFQSGQQSDRNTVLLYLLEQLSTERCYSVLRTQEQLGYIVGVFAKKFRTSEGLAILVQSIHHPEYLESRIDNFLQTQHNMLKEMSDEEFQKYKVALGVVISEKPKTVDGRSACLWKEILLEQYNFDRQNIELKELEKISHADVLSLFEDLIGPSTTESKGRVNVQIVSMTEDGAGKNMEPKYPNPMPSIKRNVQKICNLDEWKAQQMLCGQCVPCIVIPEPETTD